MIIDVHTHMNEDYDPMWRIEPFGPEDMLKMMDGPHYYNGKPRRVDISCLMQSIGLTAVPLKDYVDPCHGYESFERQHRVVIQAVKKYPDRFIGIFVWNPWLGIEDGVKFLTKYHSQGIFKLIKMHPQRHQFYPDQADELTHPIMETAKKLKIPVLIHTGDFPFAEPSRVEPLVKTFPDVNVIYCHFGTQWVSFDADIMGCLKRNENLYTEIGWGPNWMLRGAVRAGLKDKLVFGTDSPPNDQGVWVRAVETLAYPKPLGEGLSEEDQEAILGGTAARLLGITKKAQEAYGTIRR